VPREAAGQGFSLVAEDEAVVRVAFRLFRDNQGRLRGGHTMIGGGGDHG
jgi:hypothetical protein